jgi:hypothetical protein
MCEICGEREPQIQNSDDTNLGMTEGYAQDIIDLIQGYRAGDECWRDSTISDLVTEIKDKVSYLADHIAAI